MGKTVAIVGASADRRKFGNKAVRAYLDGGWSVYPINTKADLIEGVPAYATLADVPGAVDRVSMYVSPAIGKTMLDAIGEKAPSELFFNPGSHDAELVDQARKKGLNVVCACSIVDIGKHPDMYPDS
ncbi:MAG: CoA-binding protein [Candidatus Hydrogenedentes bacterium]|nr:CoA-binding protein [Candidatus Hydrogenedentota bacterium]